MIILLSPSKTLDFSESRPISEPTIPVFLEQSKILIKELCELSEKNISKLMDISPKLAKLNYERYHSFKTPFTLKNSKQAVVAFKGDVYEGLNAESFRDMDFILAQKKLRILTGLYGLLKPLDLIQPYRLEMGVSLKNKRGRNLYDFWGDLITDEINKEMRLINSEIVINLASEEYFKAIKPDRLQSKLVTISFREKQNNSYKTIGLLAKKARGMMAGYIIRNNIISVSGLAKFKEENYLYNKELSTDSEYVFTR